MDNPIFKLEKVVQAKGSEPLEDFEGPLDLILYLLSKNKIEIQDIPIALILDQYQAYLEQRQRLDRHGTILQFNRPKCFKLRAYISAEKVFSLAYPKYSPCTLLCTG